MQLSVNVFCKSLLKEDKGVLRLGSLRMDYRVFQSCAAEKQKEFRPNIVEVLGMTRVIKLVDLRS